MTNSSIEASQLTAEKRLAGLIREVRVSVASAENALSSGDPERLTRETERLERMLRGWDRLEGRSLEHDARMLFTEGVEFFGSTTVDPDRAVQMLKARVGMVAPLLAAHINAEATVRAIESYRRRQRNKFSWQDLKKAWPNADPETWRKEWQRHRYGRDD